MHPTPLWLPARAPLEFVKKLCTGATWPAEGQEGSGKDWSGFCFGRRKGLMFSLERAWGGAEGYVRLGCVSTH